MQERAAPAGSRPALFERFSRHTNPQAQAAVQAYAEVAQSAGLSATQLALAYVNSRPFVASNLIGATTLEQLKENIDTVSIELSAEALLGIEAIHTRHPNPGP